MTRQFSTSLFPIFIIGSPRSGTSMLHWSLCQHERVWGSEESELFVPLTRYLGQLFDEARRFEGRNWLDAQGVERDEFLACMGRGVEALYASRAGGRHWLEQTPSNTWALPEIDRLLPDARYLFIHRDGRQVAESMMSLWQWPFRKAVKTWREANQCALSFESEQAGKVLRISYESLVRDPATVLAAVWRFLGLDECQESIQFITSNQPINASPDNAAQTGMQKLEPRYHGWSKSRTALFRKTAGAEMEQLGYAMEKYLGLG